MSEHPEGIVQFSYDLRAGSPAPEWAARELTEWRGELVARGLIGCDIERYGACYGNISVRTGAWAAGPGRREFLVSCTQTSGIVGAGTEVLCRVLAYDHAANRVVCQGPCAPSSETLTHGAMYDASLDIRAIVHAHEPVMWRWILDNGGPRTPAAAPYGTPAMAAAARQVVAASRRSPWPLPCVLAMEGHEDGVVSWGGSVAVAMQRMIAAYDAARA